MNFSSKLQWCWLRERSQEQWQHQQVRLQAFCWEPLRDNDENYPQFCLSLYWTSVAAATLIWPVTTILWPNTMLDLELGVRVAVEGNLCEIRSARLGNSLVGEHIHSKRIRIQLEIGIGIETEIRFRISCLLQTLVGHLIGTSPRVSPLEQPFYCIGRNYQKRLFSLELRIRAAKVPLSWCQIEQREMHNRSSRSSR